MALPVISVVKGGLPVSAALAPFGMPVVVSTSGFGMAVTPVALGGMPVFDTSGTLFGPVVIPANTGLPVITGATVVGNTLLTSSGTWSGSAATYTYQWQRNAPVKSIDGTAGGQFSATILGTVTLSTTLPNDVIVLMYFHQRSVSSTISTVTSPHLTWTRRRNYLTQLSLGAVWEDLEIWWAPSSAPLASEVITITLTGATDDAAYHVFGVNGCANISSPWDANSSLATANGIADPATSATVSGVSTSSSGPLILGCTGSYTPSTITEPVGTTPVRPGQNNGGGIQFAYFTSFYQSYSSSVTSASYTTTAASNGRWLMSIDALA